MQVFVINLASSVDRRAHIIAELEKTGLQYEVVTAVDGRDLDLNDRTLVHSALLARNDFPAGTAGCALSHLSVYRRILDMGMQMALVIEDDVSLPVDLGVVVNAVAPHLTGAEVALLNYASPSTCKMSMEGAAALGHSRMLALPIDITRIVNAAAYVITREACERMSKAALPLRANADDWGFFYCEGTLDRVRCVVPLAVEKNATFESTIGLYSLGGGLRSRLVAPLVRRRNPLVQRMIRYRRERILRQRERSAIVNAPFVHKPSRLG